MGCKNGQGFRFKKTLFVYAYNGFGLNKSQKLLEGKGDARLKKAKYNSNIQKIKKLNVFLFQNACMFSNIL